MTVRFARDRSTEVDFLITCECYRGCLLHQNTSCLESPRKRSHADVYGLDVATEKKIRKEKSLLSGQPDVVEEKEQTQPVIYAHCIASVDTDHD